MKPTTIEHAKEILEEFLNDKGELQCLGRYIWYDGGYSIQMDDEFTLEELKAIVVFMTNSISS